MAARWRDRSGDDPGQWRGRGNAAARWRPSRSMAVCREPWALARQRSLGNSVGDSRSRFALTHGDNGEQFADQAAGQFLASYTGQRMRSVWMDLGLQAQRKPPLAFRCMARRTPNTKWTFTMQRSNSGVGQRRVAGGGTSRGSTVFAALRGERFCELKSALQISVLRNAPCRLGTACGIRPSILH